MNYKLLLADDSIAIQKVVELMLSDENVTLMIADNGERAFDIMQKERPDIVFIDADIPKLDGYEFCKRLRESEDLKSIPVILLVAAFGSFDERKAREVGVSSHLSKPFLAEELLEKIEKVMSEQKKEAETDKRDAEKEIIDISPTPSEKKQKVVSEGEQDDKEKAVDISDREKEEEDFDQPESFERGNDISLESISLEEEIKRAQESIDFSALDTDDLVSSLKDELNERLPDKDEILSAVREMAGTSLNESIDDIKDDIKEAVKESLASSFVTPSEVNQMVESIVKENLGLIVEDIKSGISEKVNAQMTALVVEKSDVIDALNQSAHESFQHISSISSSEISPLLEAALKEKLDHIVDTLKSELAQKVDESCKAVVIEKDDIADALKQGTQESLKHILSPSGYDIAEALKSTLLNSISFSKDVSVSIVKESAYNALITTLRELIPEIKDELISTVMHDSLVDSMKEVIKTVAWEVIPEIASKIIAEEIQKIKESS